MTEISQKYPHDIVETFRTLSRRGRGEAMQMLLDAAEPQVFRADILNIALRDYRYDHQCDSPRGYYAAQMMDAYPEKEELIAEFCVQDPLDEARVEYYQYVDTLYELSKRGYARPKERLQQVYNDCMETLLNRREKPNSRQPDREMERMSHTVYSALFAAAIPLRTFLDDVVRILRENPLVPYRDFSFHILDEMGYRLKNGWGWKEAMESQDEDMIYLRGAMEDFKNQTAQAARNSTYPRSTVPYFETLAEIIAYLQVDHGGFVYVKPRFAPFISTPEEGDALAKYAHEATNLHVKMAMYQNLPVTHWDMDKLLSDARMCDYALYQTGEDVGRFPFRLIRQIIDHMAEAYQGESVIRDYLCEIEEKGATPWVAERLRVCVMAHDDPAGLEAYIREFYRTVPEDDFRHHQTPATFLHESFLQNGRTPPLGVLRCIYENAICTSCRWKAVKVMREGDCLPEEIRRAGLYDCEGIIRYLCDFIPKDRLIPALREAGVAFEDGLSEAEMAQIEAVYNIRLPVSLRDFYRQGVPAGDQFPRWRDLSQENVARIRAQIAAPYIALMEAVDGGYWEDVFCEVPPEHRSKAIRGMLKRAPRLIPICEHIYLADDKHQSVVFVDGLDRRTKAKSLEEFWQNEFHLTKETPLQFPLYITPFWGTSTPNKS